MSTIDDINDEEIDRARLNFTLSVRENMIRSLTSKGFVPDDRGEKELLISALDGMDRTVLAKSKLKVDAKTNEISSQANSVIASLLTQMNVKGIRNNSDGSISTVPVLEMVIDQNTILPNETTIGVIEQTHEEFIKKMQ